MNETDELERSSTVAVNPGIECPLCHSEKYDSIEDHLLARHSSEELAELVVQYVMEREETGLIP